MMNCNKFERSIENIDKDILICALRYRVIVREMSALNIEKEAKVKQEKRFENLLRSGK
jgi:hypothetical protein